MTLFESLLTGLDEARRHWGQTLLSLLGLILGTASIVTVLALVGLLLWPFAAGGLLLLGLADSWVDFRRRLESPPTGGRER